jgi:mannitol-1-phosphate/altronate dehydrogenase
MFLVHVIFSFIAGSMSRSSTTEMSNVPLSSSHSSSIIPTNNISSLCLGTGRFLRSVLVPALLETNDCNNIVLIQPRGTSFVDYCYSRRLPLSEAGLYYEVDTIEQSGDVVTDEVGPIQDVISMARDRKLLSELIQRNAASIRIIGVGVTEAGLASYKTGAMHDLVWIFYQIFQNRKIENSDSICVLNTDNVPFNGDVIQSLVLQAIDNDDVWSGERLFKEFCINTIVFLNTMVDRITSQRKDSQGLVPLAEPMPLKALVIEDAGRALPQSFQNNSLSGLKGVIIRKERDQFQLDLELKLVVANAVHTACAHALALSSYLDTTVLSKEAYHLFMPYLDSFFRTQILPSVSNVVSSREEAEKVYAEWRYRLLHPHFGLSTFFIGQNGVMKSGIRLSPTVQKLLVNIAALQKNHHPITAATAFAYASILRYVTPATTDSGRTVAGGVKVCRGWLDPTSDPSVTSENKTQTNNSSDQVNESIMYADNMHVNCREGWYEFKCSCLIHMPTLSEPICLSDLLANYASSTPSASSFMAIIKKFLVHPQGGNLAQALSDGSSYFHDLVSAIATIYARMVAGDTSITILQEMLEKKGIYSKFGFETPCSALVDFTSPSVAQLHACTMALQPLHYRMCPIPDDSHLMQVPILINEQSSSTYSEATMEQLLACIVYAEVASVTVVDMHTQLFPPSYGSMCLFGIDELLTNHYLVSEYFMTAGSATSDQFYELSKTEQADVIWNALFLKKTPLSEATRGVITTLTKLGLGTVAEAGKRTSFPALSAIRASQQKLIEDQGVEAFCDMIFDVAGIKYAIMTNVPFDGEEVKLLYPINKVSMYRIL